VQVYGGDTRGLSLGLVHRVITRKRSNRRYDRWLLPRHDRALVRVWHETLPFELVSKLATPRVIYVREGTREDTRRQIPCFIDGRYDEPQLEGKSIAGCNPNQY
jgi:hypothetical protein